MTSDGVSSAQAQTQQTFSFKWSKAHTYASQAVRDEWHRWLLEKYFDGDPKGPDEFLGTTRLRILDAGCGAGVSALLLFGDSLRQHEYVGVDISDSVVEAQRNFREMGIPGTFVQANLQDLPESLGTFDLIFSEGVLHHTDSVHGSLVQLVSRLNPGGRVAFYVYARKAPIREFVDDLVRDHLADLSDEEAWEALKPLTELGRALGAVNATVEIPLDVPELGIERGTYDLQRLFYYKIAKAFYRPEYTFDEMHHVNFDWYRPANCHRLSIEELAHVIESAGLDPVRLYSDESGFTVLAALRN